MRSDLLSRAVRLRIDGQGALPRVALSLVLLLVLLLVPAGLHAQQTDAEEPEKSAESKEPREPEEPARDLRHHSKIGASARIGASVGHVLAVPFAMALPGGGGSLRHRYHFAEDWFLEARMQLSLGADETGVLGGGYGLTGAIGYMWWDVGWSEFRSDLHLGIASYSLIPLPMLGLGHELSFFPVHNEWFVWEIEFELGTDILLIVPDLSAGISTSAAVAFGSMLVGVELAADGDVLVAIVANSASGALSATLYAGFAF